jgi:hypothetical protein
MPNPFLLSILTLITTSWLVACRLAPLILVSWVVLRLMLVAVRLVLLWGTNHNTPNKTTTIVGSNLQANADNADNGQININSQNLNILSSQDTNNTKSSTQHKNLNSPPTTKNIQQIINEIKTLTMLKVWLLSF